LGAVEYPVPQVRSRTQCSAKAVQRQVSGRGLDFKGRIGERQRIQNGVPVRVGHQIEIKRCLRSYKHPLRAAHRRQTHRPFPGPSRSGQRDEAGGAHFEGRGTIEVSKNNDI